MGEIKLFCKHARRVLTDGGFKSVAFIKAPDEDAAYVKAWRDPHISSAVIVSASGLELLQNDVYGIINLAEVRAKNAMDTYDAALQGSTT